MPGGDEDSAIYVVIAKLQQKLVIEPGIVGISSDTGTVKLVVRVAGDEAHLE